MSSEPKSKIQQIQEDARAFINEEGMMGDQAEEKVPAWKNVAFFWLMVVKHFWQNRCATRASALAYTTLLALVPLLAVAVSVSTSLLQTQGGQEQIKVMVTKFVRNVAPQLDLQIKQDGAMGEESQLAKATEKIVEYVNNVRSGALMGTGMLGLVFVAISLLSTIESAFNDIWGVSEGRSWFGRVINYWAAITLGPVILLLAIGLTSGVQFKAVQEFLTLWLGDALMGFTTKLLPFVFLGAAFWLFYLLMPNTRVDWQAALVGGLVGGCLWQFNNLFSMIYVSKVVAYSRIYGSLALLPVFLIGLYFSWLIVLFGAQVAYAFQNRHAYIQTRIADSVNQRSKELAGLRLMTAVGRSFLQGEKAPGIRELSVSLGVPTRLAGRILQALAAAQLVQEVQGVEGGYAPARPLDRVSCRDVLVALRVGQGHELRIKADSASRGIMEEFNKIQDAEWKAAESATIMELALLKRDKGATEA